MTYCTMLLTARTENIIIDCVMRHLLMWIKVRYDMFTVKLILDFVGNFFSNRITSQYTGILYLKAENVLYMVNILNK